MISAVRRGLAIAIFVSLLGATAAWADQTIHSHAPNRFAFPVTTIDQGEKVTLQNLDLVEHDVTAHHTGDDGKPLFKSELIASGASGPVVGTEYLATGSYDFYCSLHSGMEATLEVSSAGKPAPRPEPEGVAVKIRSNDLDRVVETGKLKLSVRSRKGSVTVGARAKSGKSSIALGSKRLRFKEAGVRRVTLKLSDAARRALGKRKRATVIATATATYDGGDTERDTAKRTLD